MQRRLFDALLQTLGPDDALINEAIEISLDGDEAVFERYTLPGEPI